MGFFSNLSIAAKAASVFFILGKLMFIPTIASMFTESKSTTNIMIFMYTAFIVLAIIISLYEILSVKKKNRYDPSKDGIYEGKFKVIIKNGKIIKVL